MEQSKCSTNAPHMKGKHLSFEERVVIQTRLRDGWSFRKIVREIGCAEMNMHEEKFCFITAKLSDTEPKKGKQNAKPIAKIAAENYSLWRVKPSFFTSLKIFAKIIGHWILV